MNWAPDVVGLIQGLHGRQITLLNDNNCGYHQKQPPAAAHSRKSNVHELPIIVHSRALPTHTYTKTRLTVVSRAAK